MVRLGGFLGRVLQPLLKSGQPLMKVALKTSDKSVLMSFKLTTDTSALDART